MISNDCNQFISLFPFLWSIISFQEQIIFLSFSFSKFYVSDISVDNLKTFSLDSRTLIKKFFWLI